MTCRCPICGKNNSDSNNNRRSYVRAGITKDEDGRYNCATSKAATHRLRRRREAVAWKRDID